MRYGFGRTVVVLLVLAGAVWSQGDSSRNDDRPLRVLLDWSIGKEYATRGGLLNRYLDERGKTTSHWSFNWPSQSGLGSFDVLIIDNLSIFSYPIAEMKAIKAFVREGGGLLIAGHGQRYKGRARGLEGPGSYPLNKLARGFGITFDEKQARGPYRFRQNAFVDVSGEWQTDHHLGPKNRTPGTLTIDRKSEVVLADGDGKAVVAIREYGEGYVAAIADTWFYSHPDRRVSPDPVNGEFIKNIVNWLGSKRCGTGVVPDDREIRGPKIIDDGRFRVYAVEPLEAYAGKYYRTAGRVYREVVKVFGYETDKDYNLFALPERPSGGGASGRADGYIVAVGVICMEPKDEARMASVLGHEIAHTFIRGRLGQLEESFASLAAYRCSIALNLAHLHTNRDPENPGRLEDWPRLKFEKVDPQGDLIDLAKPVPMHLNAGVFGKGMWVVEQLEERYGSDFMRRYFQLLQEEKVERRLSFDEVIGYMSRVAGEDLSGWFESVGTSVVRRAVHEVYKTGEISPENVKRMKERRDGSMVGIGVSVRSVAKGVLIQGVLLDASREAGLAAGQIITAVDETQTAGMALAEAIALIKGSEGTTVDLRILSAEGDSRTVRVVRRKFVLETVSSRMLAGDVAVLKITAFNGETSNSVIDLLDEYAGAGLKGIVLDLRGNSGGLHNQIVKVAELFVPARRILWLSKDLKSGAMTRVTSKKAAFCDLPLVVVVDETTGAGELLAGALKRTKRGVLVGRTTSGAARNRKLVERAGGSADRVDVGEFYLRRGLRITDEGVVPDVVLPEGASDEAYIEKAVDVLKKAMGRP